MSIVQYIIPLHILLDRNVHVIFNVFTLPFEAFSMSQQNFQNQSHGNGIT